MSTENQYTVIKLKAVVSAMKDLEHARNHLNGLKSALEDIKIELKDVEELDEKEKFAEFDRLFFDVSQFISRQEQVISTKRFNFEMRVFNALMEKEQNA